MGLWVSTTGRTRIPLLATRFYLQCRLADLAGGFPPGVALSVLGHSASSERVRPSAAELDERQLAPHISVSNLAVETVCMTHQFPLLLRNSGNRELRGRLSRFPRISPV